MRAPRVPIRLLPVVLLSLAVACGGGHGGSYQGGDGGSSGSGDGGSQTGSRRLAVAGNPLVQVKIGGTADLAVGLVQNNLGPVKGAKVTFTIVGAAAGSTLSATSDTTDAQGLAHVTLTAGTTQTTFQVKATAKGASPVAFGVQVIKLNQTIAILRTPSVTPDSSSTSATVLTTMKGTVALKVRVTDQFGNPMTGIAVHFGMQNTGSNTTAKLQDGGKAPTTGPAGQAAVSLDTGSTLNDSFTVTARTDSSATVSWGVTVSGAGVKLCKTDNDCPTDEQCDTSTGMCQPLPACSNSPTNPVSCPQGYRCLNNECTPAFTTGCTKNSDCGAGYTCNGSGNCVASNPQCSQNSDCPQNYVCTNQTCAPPNVPVPDISGSWYTAHTFHIAKAIPVLPDLAKPLRIIDQLFLGDLGLPGWLNSMLQGIIKKYIPSWVGTVIHILDTIDTFLSDLRARGYMQITQSTKSNGDPAPAWTGTEQWQSFVFYDLDQCDPIPSNPTPDCARVDLMVDDPVKVADLGLKVEPFAGTINGSTPIPEVVVNQRKVDLHVGKLVGWLADKLVSLFTQYTSVKDALVNVVDCSAVNQAVYNWTNGLSGNITGLCQSAVKSIAQKVEDMLYKLSFNLGALTFHGTATITADTSTPPYATSLGKSNWEQADDGHYDGSFVLHPLKFPGTWYASRDPLP